MVRRARQQDPGYGKGNLRKSRHDRHRLYLLEGIGDLNAPIIRASVLQFPDFVQLVAADPDPVWCIQNCQPYDEPENGWISDSIFERYSGDHQYVHYGENRYHYPVIPGGDDRRTDPLPKGRSGGFGICNRGIPSFLDHEAHGAAVFQRGVWHGSSGKSGIMAAEMENGGWMAAQNGEFHRKQRWRDLCGTCPGGSYGYLGKNTSDHRNPGYLCLFFHLYPDGIYPEIPIQRPDHS